MPTVKLGRSIMGASPAGENSIHGGGGAVPGHVHDVGAGGPVPRPLPARGQPVAAAHQDAVGHDGPRAIAGLRLYAAGFEFYDVFIGSRVLVEQEFAAKLPHLRTRTLQALLLATLEYVAYFLCYVAAVPWIGYLSATLLFCPVLCLRCGYRDPRILLASLGVGLATVLVFKTFLQVKIPGGAVYELLPAGARNFMIIYF